MDGVEEWKGKEHGRMAIQGFVESVSPTGVSGWCIDTSHGNVVDVEIRIGGIALVSVHADIFRRDLHERWRSNGGGFRFRILPRLLSLLPRGAKVEVLADGDPMRFTAACETLIENPEGADSTEGLEQLLAGGYFVSAKSGGVVRPVAARWSADRIFDALRRNNEQFQNLFSKRFFISYGTLLGCIRNDDFIAHDDDIDVCFVSDGSDTESAAEEFGRVLDTLQGQGERVLWPGTAHFHWRTLDVFTAWFEDGGLYMYNAGGELGRDRVLPLRTWKFKGHEVLVPNDPEAVLELIYGPNWRTPDPMFQWRVPRGVQDKLNGFSERLSMRRE